MNRFIACVCIGLTVHSFSAHAGGQEIKSQRFTDVSAKAEITGKVRAMGVTFLDFDNDGFLDIFVAGRPGAPTGKGIAVGDIDGDGRLDLLVTKQQGANRLYRNNGTDKFTDVSQEVLVRDIGIESIKIEGGNVEITGHSIKIKGGKVEIIRTTIGSR